MNYLRVLKSSFKKNDRVTRERIINVIHALTENPFSYPGMIKLSGFDDTYRVRVGKSRLIYQVYDEKLLIFIQDIDSHGDIYKHI
ncbi:type II toxin-antitoxin system RelE/ParE family toxin [Cytobacillus suaedae]|nr:type II toxin-antitoxin system RelE/ParE family toxin [Cytobacillus suaedae]